MSRSRNDPLDLAPQIQRFAELWSLPSITEKACVRFSARLSRSWGRTNLERHSITLAAELQDDVSLLEAVLCHELAHVAAHLLTGRSERPHGPTWQRLVSEAGHQPSPSLSFGPARRPAQRLAVRRYLHRCPVCDFSRQARKRMTTWRCGDCVAAGLKGELVITEDRRVGK